MRTIRHIQAAWLAAAILAGATAIAWCSSALAQPSSNDINRLRPTRDLTRSIPSSGSSPAATTGISPMPPPDQHPRPPKEPRHRTVVHCSPEHPFSPCPVLILGVDDEPAPEPVPTPLPPPKAIAPAPQPVVTPIRPIIITHDMIAELQSHLRDAGTYSGPINGVFDMPTRSALIAWQRANGKKPTGSLNATTMEEFGIARQ